MSLSYAWTAEVNTPPSIREAPESSSTSVSAQNQKSAGEASGGISANPGAGNIVTGSGELGRLLGFGKESGVHLGGLWVGDTNYLISGGANPGTWSFNSLFVLDLSLDLQRLLNIQGAQFGVEFL
jgi:porin